MLLLYWLDQVYLIAELESVNCLANLSITIPPWSITCPQVAIQWKLCIVRSQQQKAQLVNKCKRWNQRKWRIDRYEMWKMTYAVCNAKLIYLNPTPKPAHSIIPCPVCIQAKLTVNSNKSVTVIPHVQQKCPFRFKLINYWHQKSY